MAITIFRDTDPTLTITVKTDGTTTGDTGFDLTSATMETRFLKQDGKSELILADGAHTIDADQATNPGKFTLDLTATQTKSLKVGDPLKAIIKATIAAKATKFEIVDLVVKSGNTLDIK